MPSIIETIREYDEDILSMIAEAWGIDLLIDAGKNSAEQTAALIADPDAMAEIFNALGKNPAAALKTLAAAGGRIPWDQFTRKFGEMREMGAARRERERPDRSPISTTEILFYKAMIGRAFFETSPGLRESAFLPDEFLAFTQINQKEFNPDLPESAPDAVIEKKLLCNDHIIDLVSTLLAGLRIGLSTETLQAFTPGIPNSFLAAIAREAGLITAKLEPSPNSVKTFLEAARGSSLTQLSNAWMASPKVDELELIETLTFEGRRDNKPSASRTLFISLVDAIPEGTWISLDNFCNWIFHQQPDILRSGGEYDAWFIKDNDTGGYLKGFEQWKRVEGAYIRMMVLKPLFWMGFVDLGKRRGDASPSFFRKSQWFSTLKSGKDLEYPALQRKNFDLERSGKIIIDRFFPREIRYQFARCCDWESVRGHKFFYQLSPEAFIRMETQGLKISQLEALINRYARKPVPRNIPAALERWRKNGREAEITRTLVVKVKSPRILDKLMNSPAKDHIRYRLNETTAEIADTSAPFVKAALLEMGVMAEIRPEV